MNELELEQALQA